MAQATLQNIDPATTDGTELAGMLEGVGAAIRSTNLGATRPSYAQAGTIWVQQTAASLLTIFIFDGSEDIPVGTVNTATNLFTAANLAPAVTLAGLGGVAATRQVATTNSLTGGGDLSADRMVQLINDALTPGSNRYYGTNSGGTKGFHALPALSKAIPNWANFDVPGSSPTWVVPSGITRVWLQMYGAGGGNRTGYYDDFFLGWSPFFYGGGPGARLQGTRVVIPGQTIAITVGAPAASYDDNEQANWSASGGNSSFGDTVAFGGQGANGFGHGGGLGAVAAGTGSSVMTDGPDLRHELLLYGDPGKGGLVRVFYWE